MTHRVYKNSPQTNYFSKLSSHQLVVSGQVFFSPHTAVLTVKVREYKGPGQSELPVHQQSCDSQTVHKQGQTCEPVHSSVQLSVYVCVCVLKSITLDNELTLEIQHLTLSNPLKMLSVCLSGKITFGSEGPFCYS